MLQDHFPTQGRDNGWIAVDYMRTFMGLEAAKRLKGTQPDDLFLIRYNVIKTYNI